MDCKNTEKLIPNFLKGEMETRTARQFLEHIESCPVCREELSIQFLVLVGMERLEEGEAFNLNKELTMRLETAKRHVRIRQGLQRGLYCFETCAILTAVLVMTFLVF